MPVSSLPFLSLVFFCNELLHLIYQGVLGIMSKSCEDAIQDASTKLPTYFSQGLRLRDLLQGLALWPREAIAETTSAKPYQSPTRKGHNG